MGRKSTLAVRFPVAADSATDYGRTGDCRCLERFYRSLLAQKRNDQPCGSLRLYSRVLKEGRTHPVIRVAGHVMSEAVRKAREGIML